MARSARDQALALWDQIIDHFQVAGPEATKSGLLPTALRVTNQPGLAGHSIMRSPLRWAVSAVLFKIIEDVKIAPSAGMPPGLTTRLQRLLQVPGEGSDHAVSHVAYRLRWLYQLDPDWVRVQIIPLFNPHHAFAEPAWSGYLHDTNLPIPELFALLKPHFLKLFSSAPQWHWHDGAMGRLNEFLVVATYWNQRADYVTFAEARTALQQADDDGRIHAAAFLARIVTEQRIWRAFGKPFIQNAWPREKRYQTEGVSRQLATLAEEAGDQFPDVVQTIVPILVPVQQLDMVLHRMKRDAGDEGPNSPPNFLSHPLRC